MTLASWSDAMLIAAWIAEPKRVKSGPKKGCPTLAHAKRADAILAEATRRGVSLPYVD